MTNPVVIQNFTTPNRLLNDENFIAEFEARLISVFEQAEKGFPDREAIGEGDFRLVLRTCTNLIDTNCESGKVKRLIDRIRLDELVLGLLVKYCHTVDMVKKNCLIVSEMFRFCCAFITSFLRVHDAELQETDIELAR